MQSDRVRPVSEWKNFAGMRVSVKQITADLSLNKQLPNDFAATLRD